MHRLSMLFVQEDMFLVDGVEEVCFDVIHVDNRRHWKTRLSALALEPKWAMITFSINKARSLIRVGLAYEATSAEDQRGERRGKGEVGATLPATIVESTSIKKQRRDSGKTLSLQAKGHHT